MAGKVKRLFDNEKLNNLITRTGYSLIQTNGQRVYAAPDARGPAPKGHEVFIGKIPRDVFEDELVPFFERLGPIYQMRLMMDFNGMNRGYGFVSYYKQELASMAVNLFNGTEVRPGRHIGVYISLDNCRLFVGGIPPEKTKAEVREELTLFVDGIKDVIMYPSYGNKKLNRGYVFVEFYEHKLAAMARRKLSPGSLVMWGVPILVDWAEPLPTVDTSVMRKVKNLYIRNLNTELTQQELFNHISKLVPSADITKTHKILDYAFVHFSSREAAEKAMKALHGAIVSGDKIEVAWAIPRAYSKSCRHLSAPQHFCISLPASARKQILNNREQSLRPSSHSSSTSPPPGSTDLPFHNNIKSMPMPTPRNAYDNTYRDMTIMNGMLPSRRTQQSDMNLMSLMLPRMQQSAPFMYPERNPFNCAPNNMSAFQQLLLNVSN